MNLSAYGLIVLLALAFAKLVLWQFRQVREQNRQLEAEVRTKQQEARQQPHYKKIKLSDSRKLSYEQRLAHVDAICMKWPDFKFMSPVTRMRAIESDALYWLPEDTEQ